MMATEKEISEVPYPSSRQFTFDVGKIGLSKHHVKALLQVDVSEAWRLIRENRSRDNRVSFFAWLIKVSADCAARHPLAVGVNLMRKNRVVCYNAVDVSIVLEKEVKGSRVPLPYVVRCADKKTLVQIQEEIDAAKSQPSTDEGDYVLGRKSGALWMKLFTSLPQGMRLWVMRAFVLSNPRRMKAMMGNLMITTVGMVGHTRGWIVPYSMHPLCLAFGSINDMPVVRKGEIAVGKMLHLAVLIDHDVIDGVPAGMFVDDLVRSMEKAEGV